MSMSLIPRAALRVSFLKVLLTAALFLSVPGRALWAAPPATTPASIVPMKAVTLGDDVLGLAFGAASCAVRSGAASNPDTLTVIDYSKPSTEKRLFVFDLHTHALLYAELVAHGSGSGDNMATHFSNDPDTHATSLGLFVAEDTYIGKNGYSLRLNGLDRGFNDHALERGIVMHGAPYVSPEIAGTGRLGRSWGCPALRPAIARQVIDRVKAGGLIFAYYPDQQWLKASKFLGGCAAAQSPTSVHP
jgi:hypothetical protein